MPVLAAKPRMVERQPLCLPLVPLQEEREAGYDSDTAAAVQRRLSQLRREQGGGGRSGLPELLYDERREQRQRELQQREAGRRRSRSRSRGRSEGRARARRGRSRSRSRGRSEERGRRSRSRSRSRERGRAGGRSRSRQRHRRAASRSRSAGRHSTRSGRDHSASGGRRGESAGLGRCERAAGPRGGSGGASGRGGQHAQQDWEALIPGYSALPLAQRMRAAARYQLERSAAHDRRKGGCPRAGGRVRTEAASCLCCLAACAEKWGGGGLRRATHSPVAPQQE
jgi:hypothetical protein